MFQNKRNITILAVGDKSDFDSYAKFHKERVSFLKRGFKYATVSYAKFLKGRAPLIETKKVIIFLFFPYAYWNKNIEYKGYKGFYGGLSFSKKFSRFWNMVNRITKKTMPDKEICFINRPLLCGLYRDKLSVIKKLKRYKIQQPKLYRTFGLKHIYGLINCGHSFFIKPRCGSMGKGITFLSPCNWKTNFIFKNNKIISRISDHGWKMKGVTGNGSFLEKLIKNDVLIQEAVDSLVLEGYKLDLRIYTFFNKIIYVYPRKNRPDKIITNVSQGGQGDPRALKLLPNDQTDRAKKIASYVSGVLGLNIAGIDVMLGRSRNEVHVIDVNVFPGFPRSKAFNLTGRIAKELALLSNKGELRFEKGVGI